VLGAQEGIKVKEVLPDMAIRQFRQQDKTACERSDRTKIQQIFGGYDNVTESRIKGLGQLS